MHQRAFEDVKRRVAQSRDHYRIPLDHSAESPPIWLVTDACSLGIYGVVCPETDWKNAKVVAFFFAKRNNPVHESELLAGVEAMMRTSHRVVDLLYLSYGPQGPHASSESKEFIWTAGALD